MSNADFQNLGDAELADAFGEIDREAKGLEAHRELAKAEAKRRGRNLVGARFTVTLVASSSTVWNATKLQKELGARLRHFRTTTPLVLVRVGRVPGA